MSIFHGRRLLITTGTTGDKSLDWKDVGKAAAKILPVFGTVLGGPIGTIVGAGGALLAEALGVKNTPEAVSSALEKATPEQIIRVKELETELNKLALEQLKEQNRHQEEEINTFLRDRQSARSADVEKTKATGLRDANLYSLAWVSVIGFYVILVVTILADMPESPVAQTALAMLFGAVVGNVKDVHGYFFGSSASSADKTELLARKDK